MPARRSFRSCRPTKAAWSSAGQGPHRRKTRTRFPSPIDAGACRRMGLGAGQCHAATAREHPSTKAEVPSPAWQATLPRETHPGGPVGESTRAAPDQQVGRGRVDRRVGRPPSSSRGDGAARIAPSRWETTTSGVDRWTSGTPGSRSRALAPSPTEVGTDIGRRWFGVLESLNRLVVRLMELPARVPRGREGGRRDFPSGGPAHPRRTPERSRPVKPPGPLARAPGRARRLGPPRERPPTAP
jgi:hypothetical protein